MYRRYYKKCLNSCMSLSASDSTVAISMAIYCIDFLLGGPLGDDTLAVPEDVL